MPFVQAQGTSQQRLVSLISSPPNFDKLPHGSSLRSPHRGLPDHSPENLLAPQPSGKVGVKPCSPFCPRELESMIIDIGVMVVLGGAAG